MKPILITGHCGWIGKNLTKLLDLQNVPWIGLDQVEGQDLLASIDPFRNAVNYCDIVVHLAATPRIPPSWHQSNHYRENNVGVTDQIARICAEQEKYLIFASSSSIYGNGDGPLNPYAWNKLAAEDSIKMYSRSMGLKYSILRFFTNYGIDGPDSLVIGKWLSQYQKNIPITVRGSGLQSRDFIHVSDSASALLNCCLHRPNNKTLDIGSGTAHQLLEISKLFNCPIEFVPELSGYATHTKANILDARDFINWQPKVNLVDWIRQTLTSFES